MTTPLSTIRPVLVSSFFPEIRVGKGFVACGHIYIPSISCAAIRGSKRPKKRETASEINLTAWLEKSVKTKLSSRCHHYWTQRRIQGKALCGCQLVPGLNVVWQKHMKMERAKCTTKLSIDSGIHGLNATHSCTLKLMWACSLNSPGDIPIASDTILELIDWNEEINKWSWSPEYIFNGSDLMVTV